MLSVAPISFADSGRGNRWNCVPNKGKQKVLSNNKTTAHLVDHWARISGRLRAELGEDLFSSWFARMEAEKRDDDRLVVSVPTRFLRNWIQSHYLDKLTELSRQEFDGVTTVCIRVRPRGVPVNRGKSYRDNAVDASDSLYHTAKPAVVRSNTGNGVGNERGSPLDRKLTFERFIVGKSNALAHAAARRLADLRVAEPVRFNPLYIHSASGLGKTHLLNAIGWRIQAVSRARRVIYLTAERFMYHFIAALRARDVLPFKDYFQSIDVLLIDDLQFLQGKSMQREFCHTFTSLVDSGRQVIVAADLPPARLDSLDTRMRSRLAGGLVIDIEAHDLELKRNILRARLADACKQDCEIEIPDEVIEFIANRVNGSGRELEGALIRVIASQQLTSSPMSVDNAATALRDLVQPGEIRSIRIDDIMKAVGRHYNVAKADLLSPRRARSIVRPRQIGMYLAKRLTVRSLPEIGRRFGGRDHSTVLHAVRKVEQLLKQDNALQREVNLLIHLIEHP